MNQFFLVCVCFVCLLLASLASSPISLAKMPSTISKRRGRTVIRQRADGHTRKTSRSRSPLRRGSEGLVRAQRRFAVRPALPVPPADELATTRVDAAPRQLVRDFIMKRRQSSSDRQPLRKGQPSLAVVMNPEKVKR